MRVYRAMWSLVVVCVAAVGVTEALLVVPPLVLWSAGIVTAVSSGVCRLAFAARRRISSSNGRSALVVAGGAVLGIAMTGLSALLAGGASGLLVVLACTHPHLVHVVACRAQRRPPLVADGAAGGTGSSAPERPVPAPAPTRGLAAPRSGRTPGPVREPDSGCAAPDRGWPDAAAIRQVSAHQLCWGWRASFTALARTDPQLDRERWSALIAVRRRYLDELARREPTGFARWLYAGARPASDPSRYLQPQRHHAGPSSTEPGSTPTTETPFPHTAVVEPDEHHG